MATMRAGDMSSTITMRMRRLVSNMQIVRLAWRRILVVGLIGACATTVVAKVEADQRFAAPERRGAAGSTGIPSAAGCRAPPSAGPPTRARPSEAERITSAPTATPGPVRHRTAAADAASGSARPPASVPQRALPRPGVELTAPRAGADAGHRRTDEHDPVGEAADSAAGDRHGTGDAHGVSGAQADDEANASRSEVPNKVASAPDAAQQPFPRQDVDARRRQADPYSSAAPSQRDDRAAGAPAAPYGSPAHPAESEALRARVLAEPYSSP